jgi:hypothetical protein
MSVRGRIGGYLCGRYRLYGRWRTVSDRLGREQVGRRLLTTIASHGGIMPPPMSASNFGRTCPPGGHAPSAVVGVAGRAGRVPVPTWTRAAKCLFRRPATPTGLLRCPMSGPHRLWAVRRIFVAWCMWRARQCANGAPNAIYRRASASISVHQSRCGHERAPKVHQTCTNDAFGTFASAKSRVTMSSCRANVTRHLLRVTCYLVGVTRHS